MNSTIFLLLLIPFTCIKMNAQSILPHGYIKGYIAKNTDTTQCWIKKFGRLKTNLYYKVSPDGENLSKPLSEITGFKIGRSEFTAVDYKGVPMLLKVVIIGEVSLYEYPSTSSGAYFFLVPGGNGSVSANYGSGTPGEKSTYYLKKGNTIIVLTKATFREDLKKIFTDNPEIIKKIDTYKYKRVDQEIQAFVNSYNEWLLDQ